MTDGTETIGQVEGIALAQQQPVSIERDFDPGLETAIPVLVEDPCTAVAVVTGGLFTRIVLNPVEAEAALKRGTGNPTMMQAARIREQIQRPVRARKAKNVAAFERYMEQGISGERFTYVPTIEVWVDEQLPVAQVNGQTCLLWPHDKIGIPIDGDTQAAARYRLFERRPELLRGTKFALRFHHGKPIPWAMQGFHDANVFGVKVNTGVALATDNYDLATKFARRLAKDLQIKLLAAGRSLGRSSEEHVTLTAFRVAVVTTLYGTPGIGMGNTATVDLPDGVDEEDVYDALLAAWSSVLSSRLRKALEPGERPNSVAAAPSVMAGLGAVAHHAMDGVMPSDDDDIDHMDPADIATLLARVSWKKRIEVGGDVSYPWEGIAGTPTASGNFTPVGAKQAGHAVYHALIKPETDHGKQIRP